MIRTGMIIRRKSKSDIAIGQYMKVMRIYKDHIYCKYIDSEKEFFFGIEGEVNYKAYTYAAVKISLDEYRRLKYAGVDNVYIPFKSRAVELYNTQPDVLCLYGIGFPKIYVLTDGYKKVINVQKKLCLKVYFSRI